MACQAVSRSLVPAKRCATKPLPEPAQVPALAQELRTVSVRGRTATRTHQRVGSNVGLKGCFLGVIFLLVGSQVEPRPTPPHVQATPHLRSLIIGPGTSRVLRASDVEGLLLYLSFWGLLLSEKKPRKEAQKPRKCLGSPPGVVLPARWARPLRAGLSGTLGSQGYAHQKDLDIPWSRSAALSCSTAQAKQSMTVATGRN